MNVVQISKEDQEQSFEMLSAVLWLGNINFCVVEHDNHVVVEENEGNLFNSAHTPYSSVAVSRSFPQDSDPDSFLKISLPLLELKFESDTRRYFEILCL
jgi:hypothetical protein